MTVLAERLDKSTLDAVLRARGGVVSVYEGPPPEVANEYQLEWSTRWGPLAEALRAQGADEATVAAVEQALAARASSRAARGNGQVAAFAKDGRVLATVSVRGAPWPDSARCGELAHVLPLLEWAQERPSYVLVVVDRAGADIEACPGGGLAPVSSTVQGPDDEIEANDAGGFTTQGRAERRAEDSWRHNARAVADEVSAALERVGARILVVSGDGRAVQLMRDQLPDWVHRTVTVEQIKGSRAADGSQQGRGESVAAAVHDAVRSELEQLWTTFVEEHAPGSLGVEGEHATLEALMESRVGTLLVHAPEAEGRTAWCGHAPIEVQPSDQPAPPWPEARLAPLVDVAVRSALLTGARVRVIPDDAGFGLVGGVGGLCRFR